MKKTKRWSKIVATIAVGYAACHFVAWPLFWKWFWWNATEFPQKIEETFGGNETERRD